MIQFIPNSKQHNSSIGQATIIGQNLVNKNLASQLNEKLGNNSCSDHPNFENKIIVDFKSENDLMTVESYCCEEFKQKLILVTQNKNPFKGNNQ
jgi:hypothetical protein